MLVGRKQESSANASIYKETIICTVSELCVYTYTYVRGITDGYWLTSARSAGVAVEMTT